MYVGYRLIEGPLGLALCKIIYFLQDVSTAVFVQSLVLVAVDRYGAAVLPLRRSIISSKLCPYFILATWIVYISIHCPYFFNRKLIEIKGKRFCKLKWNDVFGKSSSVRNYFLLKALFLVLAVITFAFMAITYSVTIFRLGKETIPGRQLENAKQ